MLTNPSIRCATCGCTDLEAQLVAGPDGQKDVAAFDCRACGFGWKAWETPLFSTPDYRAAYSSAPDLMDEELALLLLAEGAQDRPVMDSGEHREFLLRKAAYLDRAARDLELDVYRTLYSEAAVDTASTMAARSAFEFLQFDLEHGSACVRGPIGPGSPEFDAAGGARAFVRQEYVAWRRRQAAES